MSTDMFSAVRNAVRFLALQQMIDRAGNEAPALLVAEQEDWRAEVIEGLLAALGADPGFARDKLRTDEPALAKPSLLHTHFAGPYGPGIPKTSSEEGSKALGDPSSLAPSVEEKTKVCRRCGQTKPMAEYGKDVRTSNGRAHTCSECKGASRAPAAPQAATPGNPAEQVEHDPGAGPGSLGPGNPAEVKAFSSSVEGERKSSGDRSRVCGMGEHCVHYKDLAQPAKLATGNKGKYCYACKQHRAATGRAYTGPAKQVRKRSGDPR